MSYVERLTRATESHRAAVREARMAEGRRDDLIRDAQRIGDLTTREIAAVTELSYARVAAILAGDPDRRDRPTLHGAMVHVLRAAGGGWMRADEVARAVYDQELYQRKDRGAIPAGQIRARAAKYPQLFEGSTDGSNRVRLRAAVG